MIYTLEQLDEFAIVAAKKLAARQPRGDWTVIQLPVCSEPALNDVFALWHVADGQDEQVTLQQLGELIGGGGGGGTLPANANLGALAIYNYVFYGAIPTSGQATNNDTAMTKMLTAMSPATGAYGGMAFITAGSFPIDPLNFTVPDQTIFIGAGVQITGGAQFAVTQAGTLFNCSNAAGTPAGTYFHYIGFSYPSTAAPLSCAAIQCDHSWNTRAFRCTFTNTPQTMVTGGRSISCGLEQCTINYSSGQNGAGPGGSVGGSPWAALTLAGPQNFAIGPGEFLQSPPGSGNPSNTVCIALTNQAEHAVINNLHISNWYYGISYGLTTSGGSRFSNVTAVEFANWVTCVYMQPVSSPGGIYGEKYTGCTFNVNNNATSITTPCVYIDTNGQANNLVEDIYFVGCTFFHNNGGAVTDSGHGLQINTGNNINVIGCRASGNGASGGAGIAITGNCGFVTITGCDLEPKYHNATSTQNQQYAILVSGSPTQPILVNNCPMTGYSGSPISVTGSPTEFIVLNCPGYNDQGTSLGPTLNTSLPTSSGTAISASTAGTLSGGTSYWGPSEIYLTAGASGVTFHKNGVANTLLANQVVIVYVSSPYDQIWFSANASGNIAAFTWMGK